MNDLISRQAAIDAIAKEMPSLTTPDGCGEFDHDIQITDEAFVDCMQIINELPSAQPEVLAHGEGELSAQPEQRYTEEELRVFQHGISRSLLSKRSAQHWRYDEDTATEIEFLERLYDKVSADMKGGQG